MRRMILQRIHTKPEEFQIVKPIAFITPCGIADINSNGNILKENSNHTP
jgi:hypothetical protein